MYVQDFININNLSSRKKTPEGYLKARANFTKVGVQKYRKSEITGDQKDSNTIVGVFRSPDVIFNDETIESLKQKPITLRHPSEPVNTSNFKMYSIGSTGENISKIDDMHLGGTVIFYDEKVISDIENNTMKEISLGYDAAIKESAGNYQGEEYQYEFTGAMVSNHCAVVDAGRCGSSVSIQDKKDEVIMSEETNVKENENVEETVTEDDKIVDQSNEEDKTKENNEEVAMSDKLMNNATLSDEQMDNAVRNHYKIMNICKNFINDEDLLLDMSHRQKLEKSYMALIGKEVELSDKSDDFLLGALTISASKMKDAKTQQKNISDSIAVNMKDESKVYSALEIQKMARG